MPPHQPGSHTQIPNHSGSDLSMQRSELILGTLRGISALFSDRFLPSTRPPGLSHAYVEFRPQKRTCEVWQQEVLEVFLQSQAGDYGSPRLRILNERVVELRTYKLRSSDDVYRYLVAAVSTQESPERNIYMRLEMGPVTYPAIVERLDFWPKDTNILVEQTCFTDPQPVLLDLILLAPIVASLKSAHYEYKSCEFFFADLVVRTFQELFRYTCPKSDPKYIDPTFVILETSREWIKQPPRCFVIPFRSKMLDEIEPVFVQRRREFGMKNTPKPARFKIKPPSSVDRRLKSADDADQLSEKARGKRRAVE